MDVKKPSFNANKNPVLHRKFSLRESNNQNLICVEYAESKAKVKEVNESLLTPFNERQNLKIGNSFSLSTNTNMVIPCINNNDCKIYTNSNLLLNEKNLMVSESIYPSIPEKDSLQASILSQARIYFLSANLCMSISAVFVKLFFNYEHEHGIIILTTYRNIGIILFFLVWLKYNQRKACMEKSSALLQSNNNNNEGNPKEVYLITGEQKVISLFDLKEYDKEIIFWMKFRIFVLSISTVFAFYSLKNLKLGISAVLFMTCPIFQDVLASCIFKEKYNFKYLYSCVFSLIGVIIMTSAKESNNQNTQSDLYKKDGFFGLVSVFIAAIGWGFINCTFKVLSKQLDQFNLNYFCTFWSTIILLVFAIIDYFAVDSKEITYLLDITTIVFGLLNGIMIGISFYASYIAFNMASIGKLSYLMYSQAIIGVFIGMIAFNEILCLQEVLGGCILMSSMLIGTIFLK